MHAEAVTFGKLSRVVLAFCRLIRAVPWKIHRDKGNPLTAPVRSVLRFLGFFFFKIKDKISGFIYPMIESD
jgi:hypothetical protein